MNRTDLELFKSILQDDTVHITLGKVERVTVAKDDTSVALECLDVLHGTKVVCTQSWEAVGHRTGSGDLPDVGDILLIVYAGGDLDHAFAIRRLASSEEPLPQQIKDGHYVLKSKVGKKLYLGSDTKVEIGNAESGQECTEPLLLGAVMKSLLSDFMTQVATLSQDVKDLSGVVNDLAGEVNTLATDVSTHQHPTAAPGPPSPPITAAAFVATAAQATQTGNDATSVGSDADGVKTEINNLKASPVEDDTILSDIAFTEKGGG
jgi:hypothetical protein